MKADKVSLPLVLLSGRVSLSLSLTFNVSFTQYLTLPVHRIQLKENYSHLEQKPQAPVL